MFYINGEYPKHQDTEMFVHFPFGSKQSLYNLQNLECLQKLWLRDPTWIFWILSVDCYFVIWSL